MFFAGLTSVIAKSGLKNISADTGLIVRTCFLFGFVWVNFFISSHIRDFSKLTVRDTVLLGISAFTTAISWIFYYKAIKIGNVSEVALIDKASILITLLLSFIFLQEPFTWRVGLGATMILGGLIIVAWK